MALFEADLALNNCRDLLSAALHAFNFHVEGLLRDEERRLLVSFLTVGLANNFVVVEGQSSLNLAFFSINSFVIDHK